LTQDIDLHRKKERERTMYVITHYRLLAIQKIKKCKWTETFPIDQLVDDDNNLLTFNTKKEALDTLEDWGINMNIAHEEGVRIERIH
jgi:hypothetical protein